MTFDNLVTNMDFKKTFSKKCEINANQNMPNLLKIIYQTIVFDKLFGKI